MPFLRVTSTKNRWPSRFRTKNMTFISRCTFPFVDGRIAMKQISLPLFPCYVFIREGLDWQLQILTTPGVLHIVAYGGFPAIVPQAQIDAVRRIIESRLLVESHPYMQCGDRVRVKSGPLFGLEGILTRQKGVSRLVVSLGMLGRSAAVEIDSLNVERIGTLRTMPFPQQISAST